jgi:hypothetical protein
LRVLYWSFLWRPQYRRVDRCTKYCRWAHRLCSGMEEDFVCDPCQG